MLNKKALILALVVSICLIAGINATAKEVNLLLNASFESKDPNLFKSGAPKPLLWTTMQSAHTEEYKWDNSTARTGKYSLKLGPVQPGQITFWQTNPAIYDIKVGETYKATVYAKAKGAQPGSPVDAKARITLYWWAKDEKTRVRNDFTEFHFTSDADWTKITFEVVAPEGAHYVVVGCARHGGENSVGDLWFDDIELVRVPK